MLSRACRAGPDSTPVGARAPSPSRPALMGWVEAEQGANAAKQVIASFASYREIQGEQLFRRDTFRSYFDVALREFRFNAGTDGLISGKLMRPMRPVTGHGEHL